MTFRQSLHDYLREAVDVSVFDGRLSTRPMMPALVQRVISTTSSLTHSNPVSLLPRRIQIDAYANNDKQVDAIATSVIHALDGYHGLMGDVSVGWAVLSNDLDMQPEEIDPKTAEVRYHRILDFEIAYQEVRNALAAS